jgi:hypothetical protein|tara:strand:+ start:3672 stop:3896 length:225 start_codon:yes stop_codon:yes gene_type:complete
MIIEILGMAAFGHLAADFLENFEWLPSKPFKCNQCLTFWLSIGPFMLEHGWIGFAMAGCAAITSELIYRILLKI